jgi:hypothetical protein
VATPAFYLNVSRLDLAKLGDPGANEAVEAFMKVNRHHLEDALIAATARAEGMALATAEKAHGRLNCHFPDLPVLSIQQLRDAVNQRLVSEGRLAAEQLGLVDDLQSRLDERLAEDTLEAVTGHVVCPLAPADTARRSPMRPSIRPTHPTAANPRFVHGL